MNEYNGCGLKPRLLPDFGDISLFIICMICLLGNRSAGRPLYYRSPHFHLTHHRTCQSHLRLICSCYSPNLLHCFHFPIFHRNLSSGIWVMLLAQRATDRRMRDICPLRTLPLGHWSLGYSPPRSLEPSTTYDSVSFNSNFVSSCRHISTNIRHISTRHDMLKAIACMDTPARYFMCFLNQDCFLSTLPLNPSF